MADNNKHDETLNTDWPLASKAPAGDDHEDILETMPPINKSFGQGSLRLMDLDQGMQSIDHGGLDEDMLTISMPADQMPLSDPDEELTMNMSYSKQPMADDDDDATLYKRESTLQSDEMPQGDIGQSMSFRNESGGNKRPSSNFVPDSWDHFVRGDLILNRYEVLDQLGRGGMGVVYHCRDLVSDIDVALKTLPPELSRNATEMVEVRENFKLIARLYHPYIAAAKTLEQDPETGDYFLIMEYAPGISLRDYRKRKGGALRIEKALPILAQVADALDYAHSKKIMHRDIKPSNIMIQEHSGEIKLLDFGLAAQIHSTLSRINDTDSSKTCGTAPYMAPEQWRGQNQDAKTDQFAMAVMAYELLAGKLPYTSHEILVLREAILHEEPSPIQGLPQRVWKVLLRAMAKKKAQRFPNCITFVAEMETACKRSGLAKSSRRISKKSYGIQDQDDYDNSQPAPPKKATSRFATALLVIFLAFLAIVGWLVFAKRQVLMPHLHALLGVQPPSEVDKLLEEAWQQMEGGQLKKAAQLMMKAEFIEPGNKTLFDLWLSLKDRARPDEAKARYEEAMKARNAMIDEEYNSDQGIGTLMQGVEFNWKKASRTKGLKEWGNVLAASDHVLGYIEQIRQKVNERLQAKLVMNKLEQELKLVEAGKTSEMDSLAWVTIHKEMKHAYNLFQQGLFAEARDLYNDCLQKIKAARGPDFEIK